MAFFHLIFPLSCIGSKPPWAFVLRVARCQVLKIPNKSFSLIYLFIFVLIKLRWAYRFLFDTISHKHNNEGKREKVPGQECCTLVKRVLQRLSDRGGWWWRGSWAWKNTENSETHNMKHKTLEREKTRQWKREIQIWVNSMQEHAVLRCNES